MEEEIKEALEKTEQIVKKNNLNRARLPSTVRIRMLESEIEQQNIMLQSILRAFLKMKK